MGRVPRPLGPGRRGLAHQGAPRAGGRDRASTRWRSADTAEIHGEDRRRLPAERDPRGPGRPARHRTGRRGARLRQHPVLRPRRRRRARRSRAPAVGSVHRGGLLPRPVRRVRLPRGHHLAHRARHRRDDPSPAADRARRAAGRGRGPALARAAAPGRRHRLELGRVRRPRHRLRHARAPPRRADPAAPRAVGRAARHVRRPLPPAGALLHQPASDASDPDLDRRLQRGGLPARCASGRRVHLRGERGRRPRRARARARAARPRRAGPTTGSAPS